MKRRQNQDVSDSDGSDDEIDLQALLAKQMEARLQYVSDDKDAVEATSGRSEDATRRGGLEARKTSSTSSKSGADKSKTQAKERTTTNGINVVKSASDDVHLENGEHQNDDAVPGQQPPVVASAEPSARAARKRRKKAKEGGTSGASVNVDQKVKKPKAKNDIDELFAPAARVVAEKNPSSNNTAVVEAEASSSSGREVVPTAQHHAGATQQTPTRTSKAWPSSSLERAPQSMDPALAKKMRRAWLRGDMSKCFSAPLEQTSSGSSQKKADATTSTSSISSLSSTKKASAGGGSSSSSLLVAGDGDATTTEGEVVEDERSFFNSCLNELRTFVYPKVAKKKRRQFEQARLEALGGKVYKHKDDGSTMPLTKYLADSKNREVKIKKLQERDKQMGVETSAVGFKWRDTALGAKKKELAQKRERKQAGALVNAEAKGISRKPNTRGQSSGGADRAKNGGITLKGGNKLGPGGLVLSKAYLKKLGKA
ncbi:unnamed protein product [Amoebophrya sp. A25]|nr:unnamed protein product [Amoebophrya sp. A25]|eukprot:GSA25T00025987001.1